MKCPGQDSRFWQPGAIFEAKCPECGQTVEFFKDESKRRCRACGHMFVNPRMDFGCASYCKFAEQCLGDLPPEILAQREALLKDRVAIEMKKAFKKDFRRIARAMKVARYAEKITLEEGGDPAVAISSAYLRDVGAGAADGEERGATPAREILQRLGAREELIDAVCRIVGHRHDPEAEVDTNTRIVHDAELLADLEEHGKEATSDAAAIREGIRRRLLTESARALVDELPMEA